MLEISNITLFPRLFTKQLWSCPGHQNSTNFRSIKNLPPTNLKEGFQNPVSVQTWCQDFNCQSNSVFHSQYYKNRAQLHRTMFSPSHSLTEPQTLPGGSWTTACVKLLSLCKSMGHHLKGSLRSQAYASQLISSTENMRAWKVSEEQWLLFFPWEERQILW